MIALPLPLATRKRPLVLFTLLFPQDTEKPIGHPASFSRCLSQNLVFSSDSLVFKLGYSSAGIDIYFLIFHRYTESDLRYLGKMNRREYMILN